MYMKSISTLLSVLLATAPGVYADDTIVWTVNCGVLSVQRSDPIISPGVPSGHVHAISGGTAFSRTMLGIDAASKAEKTTCDKFTDHSNYWCPQLYSQQNGMFKMVKYTGVNIYYKKLTCNYDPNSRYCPKPSNARAFPAGLRMIAGDPFRRTMNLTDQSNQAILFESGNSGEVYGFPPKLADRLQLNVRFPSCWDGVNLDSPDHKSHVSYPDPAKGDTMGGMCPASHPVALFSIGAEFGFDTSSLGLTTSSSLVFSNGDTTGYGAHGDFMQGWTDLNALQNSFSNCKGPGNQCAWNSFGTPDGKMGTKSDLTPEISALLEEEDLGFNGPIAKLPGNNPVYVAGQIVSQIISNVVAVPTPTAVAIPTKIITITTKAAVTAAPPTTPPADEQETTLIFNNPTPTTIVLKSPVQVVVDGESLLG